MRHGFIFAAVSAFVILSSSAVAEQQYVVTVKPIDAPKGFQKVKISKATIGQQEIKLWRNYAINPDCTEVTPSPTLSVVEQPAHGTARISNDPSYPDFPLSNVRAACNAKKIPMRQAFYQAEAGFTGHDRLVLEGSLPAGVVRRITVSIDVR